MASITLELKEAEIKEALKDYVTNKMGFGTTDSFRASVKTIPGDRPFDSDYTYATVTGVNSRNKGE
jgi:hypothetical protein